MVRPLLNWERRRSVVFLQRIRLQHPKRECSVLPSVKTDTVNSTDRLNSLLAISRLSTSTRSWRPQTSDGLESFWSRKSSSEQSVGKLTSLMIRNSVHAANLDEPIESVREFWNENLLCVMRREDLISENRPVLIDTTAPEKLNRLPANVVRPPEQELRLCIAKSNIKLSNLQLSSHMRAKCRTVEEPGFLEDPDHRPSNEDCECDHDGTATSFPTEDFARKTHSFSRLFKFQGRHPVYGQSRHYSTKAASEPAAGDLRDNRVAFDHTPTKHLSLASKHVGSDEVSQAIARLWKEKRQRTGTYENKLKMKRFLETRTFNEYIFTIIGSSANGFGFDDCDVDMNLEVKNRMLPLSRSSALTMLTSMRARMYGEENYRKPVVIRAVCPILKFSFVAARKQPPIEVDVNASGNVGILNTQLLYSYSRMDPRVAPLVGAYKLWASSMHVRDAQKGHLSSYSLALMVIYFLQRVNVLPVLHHLVPEFETGRGFGREQQLLLPKWSSSNSQNLGSLFQDMLRFYSDFDFPNYCISVRDGRAMEIEHAIEENQDIMFSPGRKTWGLVNIQEPFNMTNTARAILLESNFRALKKALKLSNELFTRDEGIRGLFGVSKSPRKT